jgi:hypothetical protein
MDCFEENGRISIMGSYIQTVPDIGSFAFFFTMRLQLGEAREVTSPGPDARGRAKTTITCSVLP